MAEIRLDCQLPWRAIVRAQRSGNADDRAALGKFLDAELLKLPAVKDASTSIVLNEVKPKRPIVTGGW